MYNPFAQHIGIWYAKEDESEMINIMNTISGWCKPLIEMEIYSKFDRIISFKDGTWIKFFPVCNNIKGVRCTNNFIINPKHIDKDIIDYVIRPTMIGGDVYIIDSSNSEELWHRIRYRLSYNQWYKNYYE